MRAFLDTNVLVSAFTARGLCAELYRMLLAEHEVMTGEVNLAELRRVLAEHFRASESQLAIVEGQLRDQLIIPRPSAPSSLPIRNSDDGWVLASAIAGAAEVLITGDKDLLAVATIAPLPILTPREAWERLRAAE
ncbi:MAG: putative toxin-antitoxin system toxin component, PIN family [Gemmatimonadales bacterium]|nr:putative toxin-antitoxin system toxin component, PIN family [Gemmatimonadales bacterium]